MELFAIEAINGRAPEWGQVIVATVAMILTILANGLWISYRMGKLEGRMETRVEMIQTFLTQLATGAAGHCLMHEVQIKQLDDQTHSLWAAINELRSSNHCAAPSSPEPVISTDNWQPTTAN